MRHNTPPSSLALGRQLADWRRPLAESPEVDEAVTRMLRALDRTARRESRDRDEDSGLSRVAAD
jgi:hypothetical protein